MVRGRFLNAVRQTIRKGPRGNYNLFPLFITRQQAIIYGSLTHGASPHPMGQLTLRVPITQIPATDLHGHVLPLRPRQPYTF